MKNVQILGLSTKQKLIFDLLKQTKGSMSAYEILDSLRDDGVSAPPTVYRALNYLISKKLVHKIESLNVFVACNHSHEGEDPVLFEICNDCGQTREFSDEKISSQIFEKTDSEKFRIAKTTVEILGQCEKCTDG